MLLYKQVKNRIRVQEISLNNVFRAVPFQNVKNFNKRAVLDLIRFTPGGISRVELAKKLDLTRAAVSSIVKDLMDCDVIREVESRTSTNGRPPIILAINPDAGYVAGVDMGATHLNIVVTNLGAQVVVEAEIPFDISAGPIACINQANKLLEKLLEQANLDLSRISAIGVGVPGPISADAGMVIAPPIMPGWDGFPIRDSLINQWGCPVTLNNDADLGALGEWAYGAARNENNLAYIKVGTGVGAGLLINGRIYSGSSGAAGEIGHTTIDEDGPLCKCGNYGCLEASASGTAIASIAIKAIEQGQRTELANIKPYQKITAKDIANAASRGDLFSQQLLAKAGSQIGSAIASLINLLNPEMIVVGGGLAQVGDLLLEPLRDAVKFRSLQATSKNVRISTALLERRAISMGAVVRAQTTALYRFVDKKRE